MKYIANKAVILSRVSSYAQEDGQSLDAQLERGREYAKQKELKVLNEYRIVESSTRGNRTEFNEMLDFVKFLSKAAHTKALRARYKRKVTVGDVFNNRLIKSALRNKWNEIEAGMSKLPSYQTSFTDYINDAVKRNSAPRGNKLLRLIPVAAMIAENGIKATRNILGCVYKTERKVDEAISAALELKIKKHAMIHTLWITDALKKFTPLTQKSLMKHVNYCKLLLIMKNTQFFTIEEVSKYLRVSEMTIYRYIKAKKLTAYKLGRKAYRIKNADLPLG